MEYDKDGNLMVEVEAQPQVHQFTGNVGFQPQMYAVQSQNRPNSGAQFLIGIIFPWVLFGGFAILAGMSNAILYETNDYDYYETETNVILVVGNGQNTEFSGVDKEMIDLYDMCGDVEIYNWYPPPEPYTRQWIEIGALTQNAYGHYTDCEHADRKIWLFREYLDGSNRAQTNVTEIGEINKNNDGVFELSFDSAPPEDSRIEYQYWPEDYDDNYDDVMAEQLVAMACCVLPGVIYLGAIIVGYAKGFVAFSNGALISTVGSIAIFFIGCFALLLAWGW